MDIFVGTIEDNSLRDVRSLDDINTQFNERMPYISQDGSKLFFSSDRIDGYGGDDIWMSVYDGELQQWLSPVNMGGQVNSIASEISPSIYGTWLFFSSDRKGGIGGYDIYTIMGNGGMQGWDGVVKNLGRPWNSPWDDERPIIDRKEPWLYFCSDRSGGYGGFDIYRSSLPSWLSFETKTELLHVYHSNKESLASKEGTQSLPFSKVLRQVHNTTKEEIVTVYFDYNVDSFIPVKEKQKIDYIVSMWNANPQANIEVHGHTSRREKNKYKIAHSRANYVRTLLINNNVSADKIFTRAYRDRRPKYIEPVLNKKYANHRTDIFFVYSKE